jgi:hypothetical protein
MCLLTSQQAYVNPLRNTTWESDITAGYGDLFGVSFTKRIDFGNTNFKITTLLVSAGIPLGNSTETGTYRVSGDTVNLTFETEDQADLSGMLFGNSMTLDDIEYVRVQ